jgi:hypothetical protein
MIERKLMPTAESLMRRSKPRSAVFTRVQPSGKLAVMMFGLSKSFSIARKVLKGSDRSHFKYLQCLSDRMIHGLLGEVIEHHLHRMVLRATRSYDVSIEELATKEEMRQFVAYLAGRRSVTLVGEATFASFTALFRTMNLEHHYGTKALVAYVVERFNEEQPLTDSVVAVEEFGDVVLKFAKAFESDNNAN